MASWRPALEYSVGPSLSPDVIHTPNCFVPPSGQNVTPTLVNFCKPRFVSIIYHIAFDNRLSLARTAASYAKKSSMIFSAAFLALI